jgi:lysosomal Pro-X carboxypeptidase
MILLTAMTAPAYNYWTRVLVFNLSDSMPLLWLQGAHHLDLMFSHPADPPSVLAARRIQAENIQHWVAQSLERNALVTK